MMLSLYTFTMVTAIVLFLIGLPLLVFPGALEARVRGLPRNAMIGWATMLLGGGWFLWKITQLGQSDFGDYKLWLFLLFAATLVGTLLYVKDFLAIRGIAILVLLSANVGLKSAFGEYDIPARLVLVSTLYVAIVMAILLGVAPYYARDWINWAYRSPIRVRLVGGLLTVVAAALLISARYYTLVG